MDDKPSSVPPLGKSLAPIITTGKKTADPAKIRETLSKYDQILNINNMCLIRIYHYNLFLFKMLKIQDFNAHAKKFL